VARKQRFCATECGSIASEYAMLAALTAIIIIGLAFRLGMGVANLFAMPQPGP
jgi:Flp pilus assembly pilin Flp